MKLIQFIIISITILGNSIHSENIPPYIVQYPKDYVIVTYRNFDERSFVKGSNGQPDLSKFKVKFECKADGSQPIVYTWAKTIPERRPETIVPDNQTYFLNEGDLVYVSEFQQYQLNLYCTATNKYGSARSQSVNSQWRYVYIQKSGRCWYITSEEGRLSVWESTAYCWRFSNEKEFCSQQPFACSESKSAPYLTIKYVKVDEMQEVGNLSLKYPQELKQTTILPIFHSAGRASVEGLYFMLHCQSPGNAPVRFNTEGDGERVYFDRKSQSLIFDPLLKSDEGVYSCRSDSQDDSHDATFKLFVMKEVPSISPLKLTLDQLPYTLTCGWKLEDDIQTVWLRNAISIETERFIPMESGPLTVTDHTVKSPLPGTYQCMGKTWDTYYAFNTIPVYFDNFDQSLDIKFLTGRPNIYLNTRQKYSKISTNKFNMIILIQAIDFYNPYHYIQIKEAPSNRYPEILTNRNLGRHKYFLSERNGKIIRNVTQIYQIITIDMKPQMGNLKQYYLMEVIVDYFRMFQYLSVEICSSECNQPADNDWSSTENQLKRRMIDLLIDGKNNSELLALSNQSSSMDASVLNMFTFMTRSTLNSVQEQSDQMTLLQMYDNLLNVNESVLRNSDNEYNTAQLLLNQLETFAQKAQQNHSLKTEKFSVFNFHIPPKLLSKTVTFYPQSGEVQLQLQMSKNSTLQIILDLDFVNSTQISFYSMTSDLLFRVQNRQNNEKVVSDIIGAITNLSTSSTDKLKYPVTVEFPQSSSESFQDVVCAYWLPVKKMWDSVGCETVMLTESRTIRCRCSHLTNFALIMKVDCDTKVHPIDTNILSALSYFTLSVSALSLVLLLVIYCCLFYVKQVKQASSMHPMIAANSRSQYTTLISFSATLLIAIVVFLLGARNKANSIRCSLTAIALHYFFLSVFFWSTVECFRLYVSVIRLYFSTNRLNTFVPKFFLFSCLYGWIVPAVIVTITLLVNYDNYGYEACDTQSLGLCFLKQIPFYYAFLVPAAITLLLDLVIFSLLVHILRQSKRSKPHRHTSTKSQDKMVRKNRIQSLFSILGFSCVLCLSWLFGLLQVSHVKALFQYLFVVTTGLQGFFLFLCYAIFKPDVRKFLIDNIACLKQCDVKRRSETTSSNKDTSKSSQNWTVKTSVNESGEQGALIEKIE